MIPVASEVRNAIRAGASQRVLLYFVEQGMYFTVNDIILGSYKYTGSFNPDTELTMGKAVSAQLEYSLINEDGALNGFTFGEFDAYMGVKMGQFPYMVGTANVVLDFQGNRYAGYSTAPYLRKNGEAYPTQPSAPVEALIAIDDTLYCISGNRTVLAIRQTDATQWSELEDKTWLSQEAYTWDSYEGSYSVWTATITDDLTWAICKRYIEKGAGVSLTGNSKSLIFKDGIAEEYQYTQTGHFFAYRPARVRTNAVKVVSYDAMQYKLSKLAEGLTTPTTLQGLYDQLVSLTGVTSKAAALLNGSMPVPSIDFSDMTYRDVLGWIAEASCTYALFDYDGRLDLRWFTQTDISIDEHNYKECIPYEYTVKRIDKLQVRSSQTDIGIIVGTGTNGYAIQGNPFLSFESDAAGRPYCQAIYDRLNSLAEYTPGDIKWFVDFIIQPGDIISVKYKYDTYVFPIFMQDYTWTGICAGSSDCTGTEYREVMSKVNRQAWREQTAQTRKYNEISETIDGLSVKTGVDNLSTGETLYSKIEATASDILTEVSHEYVTQEDAVETYVGKTALTQNYYSKTETNTQILQAENRISQSVSASYYTKRQMDVTVQELSDRIAQSGTHTYVQLDPPANPGVGDLWVRANPIKWEAMRAQTWGGLKTQTWGQLGGGTSAPEMYVWTGETWLDTNVQADFSTLEEEIETVQTNLDQTASSIRSEVESVRTVTSRNTGSIESLTRTVAENKSSIEQTAGEISTRVDSVSSDLSDLSNTVTRNYSTLDQKADQISATVEGVDGNVSDLDAKVERYKSAYDQRAGSIELSVTGLSGRVNDQSASLSLLSDEISSKVSAGDIASAINQTAQSVKIQASKIQFEGLVTANENFKILTDGSIVAKNGSFSGTMTAGNWTFDNQGSRYENNSIAVNMTILTGGADMVGGGSDYRAFYGSSGCDVQYGSDYNYQAIIRGKNIKIISQVGSVSDFRSAEFKKIDSANDMTFVCGESTGNQRGSSAGNLGCEAQAWDTAWIRSLRYYSQSSYSARALKHDIKDMPEMGEIIDRLKPVTFAYNGENRTRNGLIYEDTHDIYPTICVEPQSTGNETSRYGSINYIDLVPVLLREIQSLRRRMTAVEVA